VAGRFLELGLAAPDILESLHFYRTLGFTELAVGEVWPHKYAVVTDGRIFIGLHEHPVDSPVITLVQPSLRQHVLTLQDAGTPFELTRLGEDEFNLAVLHDPDGLAVMLVEARTYSPAPETPPASLLGECLELALPVRDGQELRVNPEKVLGWTGRLFPNMQKGTAPYSLAAPRLVFRGEGAVLLG